MDLPPWAKDQVSTCAPPHPLSCSTSCPATPRQLPTMKCHCPVASCSFFRHVADTGQSGGLCIDMSTGVGRQESPTGPLPRVYTCPGEGPEWACDVPPSLLSLVPDNCNMRPGVLITSLFPSVSLSFFSHLYHKDLPGAYHVPGSVRLWEHKDRQHTVPDLKELTVWSW